MASILPLAFVALIFASGALAESETQSISSILRHSFGGEVSKNGIHRQLSSRNPFECTAMQLGRLQNEALQDINVLESKVLQIQKKAVSKCRTRLTATLKKFRPLRRSVVSYKYLTAEKSFQEILRDLKICSYERLYPSTLSSYYSALTIFYASASCYYSLNPLAPAPAPVSK